MRKSDDKVTNHSAVFGAFQEFFHNDDALAVSLFDFYFTLYTFLHFPEVRECARTCLRDLHLKLEREGPKTLKAAAKRTLIC